MDEKLRILLCEDDENLGMLLREYLQAKGYSAELYPDGEAGYKAFLKNKYDLCVFDVMMPKKDGFTLAQDVRAANAEIPIIFLTAKTLKEDILEGFKIGADDYITKPFHAQLLLARANNLIRSRLLMQHQFDKKPMSEIDLASINPLDKDLLKRASQVIEQHIDDTEFDIPALCKEVGVGRSLLYTKFKALTGMTPNNFLLNYRLKHAATLLKQYPDLPIAEVSDRSGFNAPVYFSRCFKNQFGCTPQNYRKEKKQAD